MWCKQCNLETNESLCPVCGSETIEDIPVEVYWCESCMIPLIHLSTAADKGTCPICGGKTHYLSSDLRPVFPEERLLLSCLLGKEPGSLMGNSVWAANSRYYLEGKGVSISAKTFADADTDSISKMVHRGSEVVDYSAFNENIELFIRANQHRLAYLKDEAGVFIRNAASKFNEENIVISFSGGKDSTVTADLVIKALSNPSLGDRTRASIHSWKDNTSVLPAFLSPETVAMVENLRIEADQIISEAMIEDVVFYFNKLTEEEKKHCLEILLHQ